MQSNSRGYEDDNPLASWLMTGLLVLLGVTIGGLVAGYLVRQQESMAAAQGGTNGGGTTAGVASSAPGTQSPQAVPQSPKSEPSLSADAPLPSGGDRSVEVLYPEPLPMAKTPHAPQGKPSAEVANPESVIARAPQPRKGKPVATPKAEAKPESPPKEPPLEPSAPEDPPAQQSAPEKPQTQEPAEKAEPENPQRRTAFTRAVASTRQAMTKRDLAAARKQLKIVGANAQSQADRDQHDRLEAMIDNLEQFWDGIRASVAKLQPTEELVVNKDVRVAVIEASRQGLAVMYGGRREFRIEEIPRPLLEALVVQTFQKTAGSMVIVGTFLAVENQPGDHEQAKRLWGEAAKKGLDIGNQLLPELEAFGGEAAKPPAKTPAKSPAKPAGKPAGKRR